MGGGMVLLRSDVSCATETVEKPPPRRLIETVHPQYGCRGEAGQTAPASRLN